MREKPESRVKVMASRVNGSAAPEFLNALVERVACAPHTQKSALFFCFPVTAGVFLHEQVVRKKPC